MSSDEHAMLELYVLDAVDEMERRRFDKHLRACSTCRQQRDSMREVLADLSRTVAMPAPPQLREQVLAMARSTPQHGSIARVEEATDSGRHPSHLLRRRGVLAAAAAIVLAAAGAGTWEATHSSPSPPSAAAILDDPKAEHARAIYRGSVVTVARRNGRAAVRFVPAPPQVPGRVYTAWSADGSGALRNAGQLPSTSGATTIMLDGDVGAAQAVAFTTERAGTRPTQPSTPALFTVHLN